MKQVECTILGQSYILGCPEGGETSLLEAVAAVDREIRSIRDGGKVQDRERDSGRRHARPPLGLGEHHTQTGAAVDATGALPGAPAAADRPDSML